ncbi:MAG: hypothetical protein U0411_01375 [Thermodesulfovibrionales bacterium]
MRKMFVGGMLALSLVAVSVPALHAGAENAVSGKVVETMDSGGYTYVRLEKNGKKIWAAIPQTKVSKGQTLSLKPGTEMVNFESKTLKRTFDTIIFSEGVVK